MCASPCCLLIMPRYRITYMYKYTTNIHIRNVAYISTATYFFTRWLPQLLDNVFLNTKDCHPWRGHVKPLLILRAIEVSHAACKCEFRRNTRSIQLTFLFYFIMYNQQQIPFFSPCFFCSLTSMYLVHINSKHTLISPTSEDMLGISFHLSALLTARNCRRGHSLLENPPEVLCFLCFEWRYFLFLSRSVNYCNQSYTFVRFTLCFLSEQTWRAAYAARGAKRLVFHTCSYVCTCSAVPYVMSVVGCRSYLSNRKLLTMPRIVGNLQLWRCPWKKKLKTTASYVVSYLLMILGRHLGFFGGVSGGVTGRRRGRG